MKLDWILNPLGTRIGAGIAVFVILAVGVAGSYTLRSVISDFENRNAGLYSQNLSAGVEALGDVHRLSFEMQRAFNDGRFAPDASGQLAPAFDALRLQMAAILETAQGTPFEKTAELTELGVLDVLVAGEGMMRNPEAATGARLAAFVARAERARAQIISYIDAIRLDHDRVLEQQSNTLSMLVRALEVTMILLGIIGVSAILILHREVVNRRLRDAAERKADFLAYNDPLTHLANRQTFNDHLQDMMERKQTTAMLFLDLDDFKGINDTYGHGFGDLVLQSVAERLRTAVESYGGMAARLGGDEFGALLPTDNTKKLSYLCNDILQAVAEPICSEGVTVEAGVSIGVATSTEVRNATEPTPETMSRAADFALYESKENGRGTFRIYDRALDERYVEHRTLLDAIPAALDNGEFFVAYQPKVSLKTNEIYGFEALIRWERDGEVVSPGHFLPVAEESRQIVRLDLMVLADATKQVAQWNAEMGLSMSISVNLSALHFDDDAIIDEVKFALARANLPPENLTLELTETLLMEDWSKVQGILSELRGIGCRISLDDFGTGYSSLAYLRRIEADELKIDRSFVIDIEESQETGFILDAVVDIAKSLGMSIVVEGVETAKQAEIVASFGCDKGQGYLFGKPVPAQEAGERLQSEGGVLGYAREVRTGTDG